MVKLVEVWCRNLSEVGSNKAMEGAWYGLPQRKYQKYIEIILPITFIQRSNFLHEEYHSTFHCAALKARSCATEVDQLSCLFQHLALTKNLEGSGMIWVHLDDLSEIFSRIPQQIRRSKIIWQPIPWVYGFPNATPQLWWGLLRSLWTIQAYCILYWCFYSNLLHLICKNQYFNVFQQKLHEAQESQESRSMCPSCDSAIVKFQEEQQGPCDPLVWRWSASLAASPARFCATWKSAVASEVNLRFSLPSWNQH
jgi:hypothetical protein